MTQHKGHIPSTIWGRSWNLGKPGTYNPGKRTSAHIQPKEGNTHPKGKDPGGARQTCSTRSRGGNTTDTNQPTKTTPNNIKGTNPPRPKRRICIVPGLWTKEYLNIDQGTSLTETAWPTNPVERQTCANNPRVNPTPWKPSHTWACRV